MSYISSIKLFLLILYLSNANNVFVSSYDFIDIINSDGYCKDTESIKRDENNNSLEIFGCGNIFPLKPSIQQFKIDHFILNENEITKLTKEYFKELVTIMNLEIIMNNVSEMEADALENLKNLTQLQIVEPHLSLPNLILSNDCKLENLHLELKSFDSQMLSKLPKEMRLLTIENTPALSNKFSIRNNFLNIKYLRLRNCTIEIWNQSEAIFSALEYLDLSHNKLKEIPLFEEKYLNLLTLNLSYNRISSIDEKAFENLKSLEILKLDYNKIHFVHQNAFRNNMNLAAVDLSHNRLTQIELNYTNFHKYHVGVKFNRLSYCRQMLGPSYLSPDVIECIVTVITFIIPFFLFFVIAFVFFLLLIRTSKL